MTLLTRVLLVAAAIPFVLASQNCGSSEFYFDQAGCCAPTGGHPSPPSPPGGAACPSNGWDWSNDKSCCLPHSPSPPAPTCPSGYDWCSESIKCVKKPNGPSNNCPPGQFHWDDKQCCLPHGGPPSPPPPPPGSSCPSNGWSWSNDHGCCTPHNPNPPPPSCDNGSWDGHNYKCCPPPPPPPQPSGRYGHKREMKSRAVSPCPSGLDACPIGGLGGLTGDYECLDTQTDITSCGGCASTNAGSDCTAIPGAWNVACELGSCKVYTCAQGYTRSVDNKTCVSL